MPELRRIAMADIDEPALAVRCAMDETKLQELAASMRDIGLLNPLSLKANDGRYEIEAGHRRFLAARSLCWREIPALVYQPGELPEHAAKLAENVHREDLSAAEEAIWFAQLREKYNLDEDGLCALVHQRPDYVADRLRLFRDDPDVFKALLARQIKFSVARELNKCPDEAQRRYFLHQATVAQTGARVVAQWVADFKLHHSSAPAPPPDAQEAPAPSTEPAPFWGCELCGGDRDPFNLVTLRIHKHEWDQILKAYLRAPAEGVA